MSKERVEQLLVGSRMDKDGKRYYFQENNNLGVEDGEISHNNSWSIEKTEHGWEVIKDGREKLGVITGKVIFTTVTNVSSFLIE